MIYRYAAVPSRYISQSKHDKQNGITILETLFTVSLTSFVRRRLSPNEQTILLIILFAADNKRRQGFRQKNVENNLNWGGLPSSYFVVITLFVCFVSFCFKRSALCGLLSSGKRVFLLYTIHVIRWCKKKEAKKDQRWRATRGSESVCGFNRPFSRTVNDSLRMCRDGTVIFVFFYLLSIFFFF